MKTQHQQILQKYTFKRDKPVHSSGNYTIWNGTLTDTNAAVTIKILKYPHVELPKYLKKMKQVKSDYTIKILQFQSTVNSLILVTEQVVYGTLKKALALCQRLDQLDSAFIGKILLNGHVEMLRMDCNWFGTEEDIQVTEGGIKLSWNNSIQFNLVNPFPQILGRIANNRTQASKESLLPFPEVKTVKELIKISTESASEISLSPSLKQKLKVLKKKGRGWIAFKETKNKNQYFDEFDYLAVSSTNGFVRVKIFEKGKISPNVLVLNKNKNNFTKVYDTYDEGTKTVIVSQYANDGNLENYIKRLKSSSIILKEDQIQFFIYSLFEPLKSVQQSTLKSICMLHIKNIYIENGIPKIGEPIPTNQILMQILADRADVPDFYHPMFKKNPTSRDQKYDTYSLGVLLYKLMYTEYPIFPNGKVHIPTTPSYNKRLKTTLQIFLNEGGSLNDIESRIEVSQKVALQVKQNKEIMNIEVIGTKGKKKNNFDEKDEDDEIQSHIQSEVIQSESKISFADQELEEKQSVESEEDAEGCCVFIKQKIRLDDPVAQDKIDPTIDILENSPFRRWRLWGITMLVCVIYFFAFYFSFLKNNVTLLANQNTLETHQASASGSSYIISTTNLNTFTQTFGSTSQTVADLVGMNCAIDSYNGNPKYSEVVYNGSTPWILFIVSSLISMIFIVVIKIVQIHIFDSVRVLYYKQNGKGKFNLSNYITFNLNFYTLMAGHFFLYNYIFFPQTEPCLGFHQGVEYGSTKSFFEDSSSFISVYFLVFIFQLIITIVYLIVIANNEKLKYNIILNPISIFGLACFIFVLMVRIGAIMPSNYYPSAIDDKDGSIAGYFDRGDVDAIFGVLPEFLWIIELLIEIFVGFIFWKFLDKSHSLLKNETSLANNQNEEQFV